MEDFIELVRKRNPNEPEFIQAVEEFYITSKNFQESHPDLIKDGILERLVEPERIIIFRVSWLDDNGKTNVNRGYRVQMSSAIGPYKGGLRFHPTVNLSVLKFLAFEQVLKNSLTTLSMGGAKGGSDFDPKGKSDTEIQRFCQSFMTEFYRHIGPNVDIPAGDINVGSREIGYLYGQYKRIVNRVECICTGKGLSYGGSHGRVQATGFGVIYFLKEAFKRYNIKKINNIHFAISGAGNVAQYAAYKLLQFNAYIVSMSDSNGCIIFKDGMTMEHWNFLHDLKDGKKKSIEEMSKKFNDIKFLKDEKPWKNCKCNVAIPCATQNEVDETDVEYLLKNNCKCIIEGANMPCTLKAVNQLLDSKVIYIPGKASNAGGVAVSGLEMAQNASKIPWDFNTVDKKLRAIMSSIHHICVQYGCDNPSNSFNPTDEQGTVINFDQPDDESDNDSDDNNNNNEKGTNEFNWDSILQSSDAPEYVNYIQGANIAGFLKVAQAMRSQGCV